MTPRLIETMLWDGASYPRLPLHLVRLAGSAAVLRYSCDLTAVQEALPAPEGAARVRLTLGQAGDIEVTAAPLPPAASHWRLALSPLRLDSADPWLRHKTTRRALYDASRAALPEGVEEVIFLNERGEVCEGTISTLFFDRGQGMRTPPLASGCLPGVLRAELGCPEEVLRAEDLPQVRLWAGNALRGLIPAVWLG
ncbi:MULTISPECIES: aminotransferase class IV family protein [Gemmobacter]|uniref:Probable branched-chain-amino-acid aminotransferase n=1 Tax=Gemmobacter nanjingensis TaxID=488454 RepID=A0ABQ3F9F7_9RHOB|nr:MULTISPECIES: aminotransferase class IV family protein [Gemmobacter]GHC14658.1 aminotransferase class IV [Gemmobacter nanjingensis]